MNFVIPMTNQMFNTLIYTYIIAPNVIQINYQYVRGLVKGSKGYDSKSIVEPY